MTTPKLTPRAKHLAYLLSAVSNVLLHKTTREVFAHELADECGRSVAGAWSLAHETRFALGYPRDPYEARRQLRAHVYPTDPPPSSRDWLREAGWLNGDDERLPVPTKGGPVREVGT